MHLSYAASYRMHLSSAGFTVGSGCSMMAVRSQVFSFLSALRAQEITFGGLELLMTVTSLFTDMARNTPFLNTQSLVPSH